MKRMLARYPGTCCRTGAAIRQGDPIVFLGRGRAYLDRVTGSDEESEAHEAAGAYLRQSIERGVSNIWTSGGREYYRNRKGLCEDAPCCGCCNA